MCDGIHWGEKEKLSINLASKKVDENQDDKLSNQTTSAKGKCFPNAFEVPGISC